MDNILLSFYICVHPCCVRRAGDSNGTNATGTGTGEPKDNKNGKDKKKDKKKKKKKSKAKAGQVQFAAESDGGDEDQASGGARGSRGMTKQHSRPDIVMRRNDLLPPPSHPPPVTSDADRFGLRGRQNIIVLVCASEYDTEELRALCSPLRCNNAHSCC